MTLSTASMHPGSGSHTAARRGRELAHLALPYWMGIGLVAAILTASLIGLFVPGVYHDAPDWTAQIRGTDLVTLLVGVPALAISMILAARGSMRATIVWLGILGYVLYMYAIYAFDVAFNPLFLAYVAALALSLWSLVALLVRTDPEEFRNRLGPTVPVRAISIFLLAVAALFCLAWIGQIVPATLSNTQPTGLRGLGLPTNPVHVLDLSVFLPITALSGIWLWQRWSWGYLLAGVILTTTTMVGVSIVSDSLFQRAANPATSLAVVPIFAVVTLAGVGFLVAYLRSLHNPTIDRNL